MAARNLPDKPRQISTRCSKRPVNCWNRYICKNMKCSVGSFERRWKTLKEVLRKKTRGRGTDVYSGLESRLHLTLIKEWLLLCTFFHDHITLHVIECTACFSGGMQDLEKGVSKPGLASVPAMTKFEINIYTLRSILKHSGNDLCNNCEDLQIKRQKELFWE